MVQCTKLTKIKSQQVCDIHVHCLMKIEQENHGNLIICYHLQYILFQYILQLCLEQSFFFCQRETQNTRVQNIQ